MRKSFNIVILLLVCGSIIGCVSYKRQLFTGSGNVEKARKNVIIDFANTYKTPRNYLTERQGKPFDVFWIHKKQSKENLFVFSVSPEIDEHVPLGIEDRLGKVPVSYFPNNFEVKNGKLFLWKDNVTPLQKDVLNAMENFGVLDSIDVKRELGLLPEDFEDTRVVTIDHELKSAHYYVCKRSIEKYKKVITNRSFDYYKPPKLNCSTR